MTQHAPKKVTVSQLLPLFFIIFIDTFSYFLVIPILLRLFFNDHSLLGNSGQAVGNIIYGIALALSPLATLLTSPLAGKLSDKYGRKKILLFSLSAAFVGLLLPIIGIYSSSLSLIFIGRLLTGAATSSQPIAQAAITDFSEGRQKAINLGLIGLSMTLAMVLGPLVGSYLSSAQTVSWFTTSTPYWFGVFLALANLFLLVVYFKDMKPREQSSLPVLKLFAVFSEIKKFKIGTLLLSFFFLELAWSQYYQSIFLYLKEAFHYSPEKISLFVAYLGIWMCLGLTVFYRLALRYLSVEGCFKLSLLIAGAGYILSSLLHSALGLWLAIIPLSIFMGIAYPSILTVLSNRVPSTHQGWLMGIAGSALAMAWFISGFTSGWLINFSVQLPLIIAAVAMLVCAGFYLCCDSCFHFKSK